MSTRAVAATANGMQDGTRTEARPSLALVDYLTLFLIGLVVVLVSLPRLRRFALRENELDAMHLLRTLGGDLPEYAESLPGGGLAALLATSPRQEQRFEDLELLPRGVLRRHGYLFDAVETEPGQWSLRGWPWEHGRTGLGAFVYSPTRGLLGHPNANGERGGPDRPPAVLEALSAGEGWRALR